MFWVVEVVVVVFCSLDAQQLIAGVVETARHHPPALINCDTCVPTYTRTSTAARCGVAKKRVQNVYKNPVQEARATYSEPTRAVMWTYSASTASWIVLPSNDKKKKNLWILFSSFVQNRKSFLCVKGYRHIRRHCEQCKCEFWRRVGGRISGDCLSPGPSGEGVNLWCVKE